jgi:hypothetical protein
VSEALRWQAGQADGDSDGCSASGSASSRPAARFTPGADSAGLIPTRRCEGILGRYSGSHTPVVSGMSECHACELAAPFEIDEQPRAIDRSIEHE